MDERKVRRRTAAFLAFFLLAGFANAQIHSENPVIATLMSWFNHFTYVGLLLYWLQSVRARLLPSPARRSLVGAAALLFLYQLLRVLKYRFNDDLIIGRYLVYLYFGPMTLIPTPLRLATTRSLYKRTRSGNTSASMLKCKPKN